MFNTAFSPSVKGGTHKQIQLLSKAERDARSLERLARFVITIESDGKIQVTSNHEELPAREPIIPLIVVMADVHVFGQPVKAAMLEVGFKRARPYRRVEYKKTGELLLQTRDASHHLTESQFQAMYPTLLECLKTVLTETKARWNSDEPWFINGRYYERGVQITVRHSDTMLYGALLRESLTYFRIAPAAKFIHWLNYKLRYSKFSRYSTRLYGPNVRLAAASVMRSQFSKRPFWTEAMLGNIQKRMLLENALLDLHGFKNEWDTETELAFAKIQLPLPPADGLMIWHTNDQPGVRHGGHARNCARFEVIFDRSNLQYRSVRKEELVPVLEEGNCDDPDYVPF